jgi:DNA-binding NarL/FixJ family response regulator
MDDEPALLDAAELRRLSDAVRAAQGPRPSIPHREILDLRAAAPRAARLTVDYAASATLGMPLLVVRVPVGPHPSAILRRLTRREFEVAGLVAAGWTNKEIGARLGIRTSTVKEHVHRILASTGLPSRAAIAAAYVGAPGVPNSEPERPPARDGADSSR